MKTNARYAKEREPIASLRASAMYDTQRESRPFFQPSLPSPRRRPMSARAAYGSPRHTQNYPPFKRPVANLVQQSNLPWWEDPNFVMEAEPEVQEVKKEVKVAGRKWGELPPGVTPDDIRRCTGVIKEKLIDKFGTLTKAFRAIDEDASGTISIEEFQAYLEVLNLNAVARKEVITALFELIDADESNSFDFKEFSRVMSSSDVMKMAAVQDKFDGYQAKIDEAKAADIARRTHEASLVGMTMEEYENYWGDAFKQQSSADMAVVARDKWGKKIKGPVQAH